MKRIHTQAASLAVLAAFGSGVIARALPGGVEIDRAVVQFNTRHQQQPAAFILDDIFANLFRHQFGEYNPRDTEQDWTIFFGFPAEMTAEDKMQDPSLLVEKVAKVTGKRLERAKENAVVNITLHLDAQPQSLTLESPDGEKTFTISSGKNGHRTPRGWFTVDRLNRRYHSRKYNSPMPWSVFFLRGAYATHGTHHVDELGGPASMGCVRLHPDNAKIVFETVQKYGKNKALIHIGG